MCGRATDDPAAGRQVGLQPSPRRWQCMPGHDPLQRDHRQPEHLQPVPRSRTAWSAGTARAAACRSRRARAPGAGCPPASSPAGPAAARRCPRRTGTRRGPRIRAAGRPASSRARTRPCQPVPTESRLLPAPPGTLWRRRLTSSLVARPSLRVLVQSAPRHLRRGGPTALRTTQTRWPNVTVLPSATAHSPMASTNGTPSPVSPAATSATSSRSERSATPTSALTPRPSARARA